MDLLTMRGAITSGASVFDLPLRVAYYARVSTDKLEQQNSLENQSSYYDDYIAHNANWRFAGAYVDEGISGTSTLKRAAFLKMIKDGKSGRFDLIITKEISRFARDTLDSIQYTRELLAHGVCVFFQSDNINTMLPDAELRLTIMASIAQDEVRKLSERLRFGYKRSIERGRVLGQNNMLGYDKRNCALTVNEEEAHIVRRIFTLYNEGRLGIRRIARELESEGILSPFTGRMFSPETIKNVITNPKYKGHYCSGKTATLDYRNKKRLRLPPGEWNVHRDENIPAIVDEEVWEQANARFRQRSEKTKTHAVSSQSRYEFSGKLICGEHMTSYHRHVYKSKSKGNQEVWNCRLYRLKGKLDGCDSPTIYSSELRIILDKIYAGLFDKKDEVINGLLAIYTDLGGADQNDAELKRLEKDEQRQKQKSDALLDLLTDKLITKQEFAERNEGVKAEMTRIAKDMERLKAEAVSSRQDPQKLRKFLEQTFAEAGGFSPEITNVLLDKIVVRKTDGDKSRLTLEIILRTGSVFSAETENHRLISLKDIGISQAQVSRLEKSALKNMRKYIG